MYIHGWRVYFPLSRFSVPLLLAPQYIKAELVPDNNAPNFTSVVPVDAIPQVGKTWNYQASAQDADNDVLTYSLVPGASSDVTIDSGTGLVQWTPQQQGEQEFTIKVTDSNGAEALQVVSLAVSEALPNSAPVITSQPRNNVRLGNTYLYQIQANDVDGDALTYSLDSAPEGMTLENNNVIVWTPAANQFGSQEVVISVSDGEATVTQSFNVNVTNQSINNAPTITSVPELITNIEKEYTYNVTGTDADGDYLVWSLDNAPNGMVINPETGALRWNPTEEQIGEHTVSVRLTDALGAFVGQEFTLYVNGTNTPPQIVSTAVTRAAVNQEYKYQIVATDPENDQLTYSLGNSPAGMTVSENGLITWIPEENQLDDVEVTVFVTDAQGATSNQSFTIEIATEEVNGEVVPVAINNAPEIISNPVYLADTNSNYQYQVVANDPDVGDTLTYQLLSVPDNVTGMSINATTGLLSWNNPVAGTYQIAVGAVDDRGLGAAQGFTLTARANNAPVINSTPGNIVNAGSIYAYDVRAVDVDGDVLSYTLDQASLDKGITIDELGRLRWNTTVTDTNCFAIVTVADGNGGSTQQEVEINVVGDTEAPQVRLIAGFNFINQGESVTFQARATDNIGVAGLQLLINDNPVAIDGNGLFTVENAVVGKLEGRAIAIDAAGNTSEATFDVDVVDTSDTNAPTVSFSLDVAEDGIVTAPTDIIGTISDDGDIDYYTVEVAPVAGGEFKEVLRVDNPDAVTDGVLGKFDPSLLQNDSYRVRLSVYDTGGNGSFAEEVVDVAGELKLGNFRLSFTDLSVPVTGIPITLTRTYDTLTSNTTDDFGYGWRMEFRDTDLRTSLGKPTEEDELLGRKPAYKDDTRVYITLPGGKREGFTFKPSIDPISGFLRGAAAGTNADPNIYRPKFEADDGVTSTLTVKDERIIRNNGTSEFFGISGSGYNPADSLFGGTYILTTKEGIEYEIDGVSGDLLKVTDTNGNTLTYTDEAVTSSTGLYITFERDAEGRITSVKDPSGELIRYEYDDNGDLVSVTDREENVTRMEYNPEREHYLDKIIDPLGREGVKTEYGEDGRLSRILDVNGEAVELDYNPDNSLQTTKDVFGNETTYVYDERGNVVQEVNALGGITKRTFDENDNLLSITDSLGNTTEYTYDSNDNIVSITDPLKNTAYYTYNSFGQVISRTDPLGNTISYAYDSKRNPLSTTNPQGQSVKETTDEFGNTTSIIDALGNVTQFEYDERGNVTRTIDADGNETTYTYDNNSNQLTETVKVTTPEGLQELTTNWTYDTEGRVLTKTDPAGNVIRQEYDTFGNLAATVEEGMDNRRTEYRYDEKNQLIETIYADGTSQKIIYDKAGRKITEIDRAGETTHFVYDALNRLVETINSDDTPDDKGDNPRTKTEYNLVGQTIASIDELGNRTEYEYDAAGRRILKRDALGNETTYTYDAMGHLLSETDALLRTTSYVYDPQGRKIETQFADGTSIKTAYNALGLKIAETDRAGRITRYVYDALDRQAEVIIPDDTPDNLSDNPRIKTEYDELGRAIAQIDELGNRIEYEYDEASRQTLFRDAEGNETTYTYDAIGNRLTMTDPNSHTTRYIYDESNRLIETRFHDGTFTTTTYDELGREIATTDQEGKTTQFEYDPLGRLTAVIDAAEQRTEYIYDLAGNHIATIDANNHVTQYEYDTLNRRNATILPIGQRSETIYDAVGNVISFTDFNSDTIEYEYDELNRLIVKEFPDNTSIEYEYTPTGQIANITDSLGKTTYDYDVRDRLIEKVNPDSQFIRYTYDDASNRTGVITNSDTVNYTYSQNNLLKTVTNSLGITEYSYDAVGNLIKTENPNNTAEIRTYDDLNRLVLLKNVSVDPNTGEEVDTISSYDYTLDKVGNRISVEEHDGRIVNYDYDELYRLTQEEINDSGTVRTIDYTYDAIGNRLTRNDSELGLTTYIYNDNDWLLSEESNGEITTYTYDNNGNNLSKVKDANNQTIYTWDYENRLQSAEITTDSGTTTTEYKYNADGIRVASIVDGVETRYLVDANRPYAQVLEEYSDDGTVTVAYVYGHDLISQGRNGEESFYHVDGLGSTRALTDASGNVTDSYTYDAYGDLINSSGSTENNYLYTGEQYDSNLEDYYLRARYYDPSVGRFTARDPFEGWLNEPLSLAKYPYVHGNPVNLTDPTGLFSINGYAAATTILSILVAIPLTYNVLPIATIRRRDSDDVLVPGYLKDINHSGVNRFLTIPITNPRYQVVRKKAQECNGTQGAGNCDFEGFPVIVWGLSDLPDIYNHTRDAINQGKPSFLARAAEVDSSSIWSRLHPQGLKKRYPGGYEYDAQWYDFTPECPWDNNNPQASVEAAKGLDCDEYPYHSTLQGGRINYDRGNVSLRRIDSSQNDRQGTGLQYFYLYAPVAKLHPYYSWFGVKTTNGISYWQDKQGNAFYMGGNNPVPF
jgi:RHS repeat-associated protein